MQKKDRRPEHLGWVEIALQVSNPDLPYLRIWGQSHYGACDRLAFIDVFGVDDDRARRRQVRAGASNMMRLLGYAVGVESGRDVFEVLPRRPNSAHERIEMLQRLRAVCEQAR